MKKLYILFFMSWGFCTYAQLSENFDAAATLPAGWTTFIGANGLGTTQNWTTSTARYFSATRSAFVRYEDVVGGTAEDWLVTPLVNLTNYTGSSLTFYGGEQYTDVYTTQYSVRVSTTSPTDIASFEEIDAYTENDFSGIIDGASLTAGDQKTVDLSAYDGMQIYIAFVMTQDDGDNWFVDNVNVSGTLATPSFDDASIISVYPNPTNGILNVSVKESLSSIEVYNVLGSLLKRSTNSNQVDISDLSAGSYLAKITATDGRTTTQKVIKN